MVATTKIHPRHIELLILQRESLLRLFSLLSDDTYGWLKTAVAFANSCPVGQPGILYVGVENNGDIKRQADGYDFEKLQKSIGGKIGEAWPPIYFVSRILDKDGIEFVAVMIYGSPKRPHFSGRAWVRIGPETKDASEVEHDNLIAQRSSKVRFLQRLVGKLVYWHATDYQPGNENGTLTDCNEFFVTVVGNSYSRCLPVDWITISYSPGMNDVS